MSGNREAEVTRNGGLYDLAENINRDLRELRRILRKPLEDQEARLGLTPPQRSVMEVVWRSEGVSLTELSQRVGLAHSTVSGIVDRLENKGLLARQTDPQDARFTKITVSEPVRKHAGEILSALAIQPLIEALERATPAEREAISQGLTTLRRLLESEH